MPSNRYNDQYNDQGNRRPARDSRFDPPRSGADRGYYSEPPFYDPADAYDDYGQPADRYGDDGYADRYANDGFDADYQDQGYGDEDYSRSSRDRYNDSRYAERSFSDREDYEADRYDTHFYAPDEEEEAPVGENDLIDLIDSVEDLVINARTMPFTNNVIVDREAIMILINMLRDNLPLEIRKARWLISQNQQVVEESKRIAETIVRQAERREATMINEHEITLQARQRAAQTIEAANNSARQIRDGALDYANKRLTTLEEQLTSMLVTIQKNKKELK